MMKCGNWRAHIHALFNPDNGSDPDLSASIDKLSSAKSTLASVYFIALHFISRLMNSNSFHLAPSYAKANPDTVNVSLVLSVVKPLKIVKEITAFFLIIGIAL